jgi:GDP-L-fucose synthase
MDHSAKIYVAGHRGLVGSALVRNLRARGYSNILVRQRSEVDLADQQAVRVFFAEERPRRLGGYWQTQPIPRIL